MMKINRDRERGRKRGVHKYLKCTDTLTQIFIYVMYECYQTHNIILPLSLSLSTLPLNHSNMVDFYSKTSKAKLL